MAVSSPAFGVPLGPGAETESDFSFKWVALMGSTVAYHLMRSELAATTLRCIKQTGRVMPTCDPEDSTAVMAVLRVAASLGKGTHLPTATAAAAAYSCGVAWGRDGREGARARLGEEWRRAPAATRSARSSPRAAAAGASASGRRRSGLAVGSGRAGALRSSCVTRGQCTYPG